MRLTRHPKTGKWHNAVWLDDFYGRHQYAVAFEGGLFDKEHGDIYDPSKVKMDTDWESDLIIVLNSFERIVKIFESHNTEIKQLMKG